MFNSGRRIDGESDRRSASAPTNPSKQQTDATHGELNRPKLPREILAEIRAHVEFSEREVLNRRGNGTLRAPSELLPVVAALTALDFPVRAATSGFEPRNRTSPHDHSTPTGFPTILIGESKRPYEICFDGQADAFRRELRAIPVPLQLRFQYPRAVGIGGFRPEGIATLDPLVLETRYPKTLAALQKAYERSLELSAGNRPTEDESFRRECHIALALRLKTYLTEFQPRGSFGVPMTLSGAPGEPLLLVAGDPHHQDTEMYQLAATALRARIITERQRALLAFGSFLRERALRGG